MAQTQSAAAASATASAPQTVAVWDPLVRLFHCSLVAGYAAAFATGDDYTRVHIRVGYAIGVLIAVRIVWGFLGPRRARFSDFVRPPSEVLAYLRATLRLSAPRYLGHNPAGGAMVLALLAMTAFTVGSGVMLTLDQFWGAEWLEDLHASAAWATLGLVGLHVVGVAVACYEHRENLVAAMLTGRKRRG